MMDLLLDMSSQMQAMEEYVFKHSQHTLTGNQGSIPERSSIHTHLDDATAEAAASGPDSSSTIAPRVIDVLVPETVRRKLARQIRRTPMLVDTCTDESDMDEELAPRRKKAKALKSGKMRTADSTVIKRMT